MGKFVNMVGLRFGRLTVVKRSDDYVRPSGKHSVMWECLCDCGNIVNVLGESLRRGATVSCGCYAKEKASEVGSSKLINAVGKKFGMLTVLERADNKISPNGNKRTRWLCQCECGNTTVVMWDNLKSGHTTSCGCSLVNFCKSKIEDITGEKFGKLTVLSRCGSTKQKQAVWLCQCECGNYTNVLGIHLKSGHTTSCGCIKSKLEFLVESFLKNQNIDYKKQIKFNGLIGVNGGLLSYDFYLPNYNCLIECQGRQHFVPSELFGGLEQFTIQQEHDSRKKDFAKTRGYKLIEILPTTENKIISTLSNILNL